MPVYLVHGFRWPRGGFTGIRVHVIIHNLDDCSAEYIQNPQSQAELLKSFRNAYPEIMKKLESPLMEEGKGIRFLEQYDPEDEMGENAVSQPYAFVCDRVVTVAGGPPAASEGDGGESPMASPVMSAASEPASPASVKRTRKGLASTGLAVGTAASAQALSINVEEVVAEGPGVSAAAWEAFADLRDKIAPGEKIGWWVVYNGDPERAYNSEDDEEEEGYEGENVNEEEQEQEEEEEEEEEEAEERKSAPQPQPQSQSPNPTRAMVERTRPSQPSPKPPMFEQSDPNIRTTRPSPLSPLRSPSSPASPPPKKGSGKRLPGMKALPQQQQPPNQPLPPPTQPQPRPEATKPKVVPKSESLKRKLFGKRS